MKKITDTGGIEKNSIRIDNTIANTSGGKGKPSTSTQDVTSTSETSSSIGDIIAGTSGGKEESSTSTKGITSTTETTTNTEIITTTSAMGEDSMSIEDPSTSIGKNTIISSMQERSARASIMKKCSTIMEWYMGGEKHGQRSLKDTRRTEVRYVPMYVGAYYVDIYRINLCMYLSMYLTHLSMHVFM